MPQTPPRPSVGRIVTYRSVGGHDLAAVIVAVPGTSTGERLADGHVELHIFPCRTAVRDYINDQGVPYSEEPAPGTWRWPERV